MTLPILCTTAASIALVHTLLGPDHYLPFVAMSRARQWSLRKTVWITLLCGLGHVLSSFILGLVGVAAGFGLAKFTSIEEFRGNIAGWMLLSFGLLYFTWGLRQAIRNKPHTHWHTHADGTMHNHNHIHHAQHLHVHETNQSMSANLSDTPLPNRKNVSLTPWILFTVFLFGPCEPLIPLLMLPAVLGQMGDILIITGVFGATTLLTMTTLVVTIRAGVCKPIFIHVERYSHALAGLVLSGCGLTMTLGW